MRKILVGIFVIMLVLMGTALAIPFLFKDKIVRAAKDAANQEINAILNFESIDVSLLQNIKNFPDITLVVHNPFISGIGKFAGDTLVKMEALKLALDIKSVFQTEKPMNIYGIELVNAYIYALVAEDGQANWNIAKQTSEKKEESKFWLAIKEIKLNNVNIVYKDIPANNSAEVYGLNHKARGNFSNNLVKYASETSIEEMSYYKGLVPYLKSAKLENESVIEIDQAAMKYKFSDNKI